MIDLKPTVPIFRSFNESMTRDFYLGFLGSDIAFEHRFSVDAPLYMGVKRAGCEIHLSEHFGDAIPGSAVRIEVDNVDAYCAEVNAKDYRFAAPGLQDQEWGWREMTVKDPSGNRLVFCSPLHHG